MSKVYTKCVDCGKDKFHDDTKRCSECKKKKMIQDNEALKQEKTIGDFQ